MNRVSLSDFIKKANELHGNKYDYSNIKYIYSERKISIICPIHGEFKQTPNGHLLHGCKQCGYGKRANSIINKKAETFIQRSKVIYGDTYDYSRVEYSGIYNKVVIICPIHGEFQQTPYNHITRQFGCVLCGKKVMANKITRYDTDKIIQLAHNIHGNKYNYSKAIYTGTDNKMTIICHVHGEFQQSPYSHIKRRSGCKKCSYNWGNNESIIRQFRHMHGNRYDYSKVEYNGLKHKVTIVCPTHGEFHQTPHAHSIGKGCVKCGNTVRPQLKNQMDIITQFLVLHENKYDYSKVIYNGIDTKITIICPIHGEFQQTPYNHRNGSGCQKCAIELRSIPLIQRKQILTKEHYYEICTANFITKANKIHKNKYDYSKTIYKGSKEKIIIICTHHGKFKQSTTVHLRGGGCKKCNLSYGEMTIVEYLINNGIKFEPQYIFKDCCDIKALKFDFAIWVNNAIGLIEFNGIQHYTQIKARGNVSSIQRRDNIKFNYAQNNNIPLLIIPYTKENFIHEELEIFITSLTMPI